ncbi:rhodanese-like domain-containing protein [Candidatus Albibeggiatoa sp. nov. NOAA]|uniref:rhodanese-like domain-containing protein n=1 Tax=Candidatus Albibeggiatoa sp. nov. NOAA TaxID=3162724 RepID=UPI0032F201DA|nr:rhodanese-like domain-containing protein [Thiotrichaceae bacterium]
MSELKSILPKDAWQLLQDNPKAVLIDIRSTMEYLFVGHPVGSVHVAWIDEPDWEVNPHFEADVRKVLLGGVSCPMEEGHPEDAEQGGCAPVLLICRSGKRSLEAGHLLCEHGFGKVYNVLEGFEGDLDEHHHRSTNGGWRYHDLPWEQC